jgi:hypothetical protein
MTPAWTEMINHATYGGTASSPPYNMYMDIGSWYVSTK